MQPHSLLKALRITAYDEVQAVAETFAPEIVVSLLDPGVMPPVLDNPEVQHEVWHFHDDFLPRRGRVLFSLEHAASLLPIAEHLGERRILLHCMSGLSRSTAVALAWIGHHLPDLPAPECVDLLAALRPQAQPNRHVLNTMGRLSGRGESLSIEISRHPQLGWH